MMYFHYKMDGRKYNFTLRNTVLLVLAALPVNLLLNFRNPVGRFMWKNSVAGIAFMVEGMCVALRQSKWIYHGKAGNKAE
jgi:hypothetical protein